MPERPLSSCGRWLAGLLVAVSLLAVPASGAAQVADTATARPAAADTAGARRGDTTLTRQQRDSIDAAFAADSAARAVNDSAAAVADSITQQYLAGIAQGRRPVPVLNVLGAGRPEPAGARIVFTRDSLEWMGIETVGDLLARVSGVFLLRERWIGRAEIPTFRGRGPNSVEYVVDGVPYLPLGVDSVGVDPSLFALSWVERVEVERWPSQLRVSLITRRWDRTVARSRLGLGRGSDNLVRAQLSFEKRWPSGVGVAVGGDYLNSGTLAGGDRFRNTTFLVQGNWVRRDGRWGVQAQLLANDPRRLPIAAVGDTLGRGLAGGRAELQLRAFVRRRNDGLGPGLDLVLVRSTASDSAAGVAQSVYQASVIGSLRSPTAMADASVTLRSRWTPLEARVRGGWTPTAALSASAEAVVQRHDEGRTSAWVGARGGLELGGGLSLRAGARVGRAVFSPAITADTAQTLAEAEAALRWGTSWIGVEAGVTRTAAFAPRAPQQFGRFRLVEANGSANWFTLGGYLAPARWLRVDGWYSTPSPVSQDGQPPHHVMVTGTIRSKFLRQFPSGVLDLKGSITFERWGRADLGFGANNAPITLAANYVVRSHVELELGTFAVFLTTGNLTGRRVEFVPGLPQIAYANAFGIRWTFFN